MVQRQAIRSAVDWYLPRGRMSRRNWWLRYVLPILAVGLLAMVADLAAGVATFDTAGDPLVLRVWLAFGWLSTVYWLLVLVPMIAAQVARLHDRGMSAGWMLLNVVPVVGQLALLVPTGLLPGDAGPNRFGPAPSAAWCAPVRQAR